MGDGRTGSSALFFSCHSEPVTDVTGVGIRNPRPLPLPLGEVAERSEDGEGKQKRTASLCEAAQCSHWVVRRSVAEVSRRSRDGGIVLAGGAEPRLYTRFFGGRFVGGDAHIAPPRPQARSCLPTPLPMHRVSVPYLSLWERWPSAARTERANKKEPPPGGSSARR